MPVQDMLMLYINRKKKKYSNVKSMLYIISNGGLVYRSQTAFMNKHVIK